jgi:hypothetical protein
MILITILFSITFGNSSHVSSFRKFGRITMNIFLKAPHPPKTSFG